ncbi:MAG: hypothetical protein ACMG6S_13345 [Byssovorax sp.]
MKIVLFVEGHTEKKALPEFLKLWLDSRLSARIGIAAVDGRHAPARGR